MAEAAVEDFLTCPVCLDTFTEPVSLTCHHSFCYSCLQNYWDQNQTRNCPVCRRRSSKDVLRINFALRELGISFRQKQKPQKQSVCSTHPEVPPLFCKDEARALCPVCEFSLHTRHTVVSGEKAERELKEQLRSQLHSLTQQRQCCEELQETYERLQRHSEEQVEHCEHQIRAVFSGLHQFLKEEEDKALAALTEEQHRQAHTMGPELQSIREQLSSLNQSIQDLEQQLHSETHYTHSSQPCLRPKAGLLINQAKVLGNLGFRVWRKMRSLVTYSPVILDPNSAQRWLHLSEDLRGVRQGDTGQELPDNPERFSKYSMILGSEGFSFGTHQWDVEVGDHQSWSIGVAKESVDRKGKIYVTPEYGIWCLFHRGSEYTNGCRKPVKVEKAPEKIRVKLDYDRGKVSFYDTGHMTHLCTHTHTFTEKLFPFITVGPTGAAKTRDVQICPTEGPQ